MSVSNQIIEVLEFLGNKFGIAIDWSSENILPMVQTLCEKYIRWEISTSTMWICISVFIITLFVGVIMIYDKHADPEDKWDFNYNFFPILFVASGTMIGITCLGIIGTQIYDIIKCYTFPELRIFEYVSMMIENMK
jgi:heme/copper-type cytochrome/quinol oxidase subunit 2